MTLDPRILQAEQAIADAEARLIAAQCAVSDAAAARDRLVQDIIRESLGGLGPWGTGEIALGVRFHLFGFVAEVVYGPRKFATGHGDTPRAACLAALDALPREVASSAAALRARVTR